MARIELAPELERALEEQDDEPFDRLAFAAAALQLLRPPRTRVALLSGTRTLHVETGRLWGRTDGAQWAMLSVPARASRRAIALAVLEIAGGDAVPWALDVLLAGQVPTTRDEPQLHHA